jgi:hypothetical protein
VFYGSIVSGGNSRNVQGFRGFQVSMNRYAIYTGPTIVNHVAACLNDQDDITVTVKGTAHVYVETMYSPEYVLGVMRSIGCGWTLSDIRKVGY